MYDNFENIFLQIDIYQVVIKSSQNHPVRESLQVKALWNRDWRMDDWRDASKANFLESYFWFCKIPIIIADVPA